MQGHIGNGLFPRWSTGHQPADHHMNERDTSVISPNVQQLYREKEIKQGSSGGSIASTKYERQLKKQSIEENEKACLSSCGGTSSPMSWMYDKKSSTTGKQVLTSMMTDQGMGKVSTQSSGHVDDASYSNSTKQTNSFLSAFSIPNNTTHNNTVHKQNSRTLSENNRNYPQQKFQVESQQRMPNFSSQSSTSKAQQFLHGDDSDEEFFNAQPEALLDVNSNETFHQQQNQQFSKQATSSAAFAHPRQASKQQKQLSHNSNQLQQQSLGRFSPQPSRYPSKSQSNLQQLQVIQEETQPYEDGPYIQISNIDNKSEKNQHAVKPYVGESRIVAPNVSKLSPNSAVEVRLQSAADSVVVLCSVDVLKMRSGFFHNLLNEQESQMMNQQGTGPLTSTSTTAPLSTNSHILWRETIVLDEQCPFEAAAFLESIHEGRTLFRGEWNYCWARLSVAWIVEDLILEYATQIDQHIQKILSTIQQYHWRTNPNILAGMRICIFRKGSNPSPTIVSGMVVDSPGTVSYSKVRVAFDNSSGNSHHHNQTTLTPNQLMAIDRTPMKPVTSAGHPTSAISTSASTATAKAILSPRIGTSTPPVPSNHFQMQQQQQAGNSLHQGTMQLIQPPSSPQPPYSTMNNNPISTQNNVNHSISNSQAGISMSMVMNHQIVGDVAEPFWVQSTSTTELAQWCDPDELFTNEAKKLLTTTDKRIFWEMARAIIELPEISKVCKGAIRTVQDLVSMLKRAEFRVMWTAEAADIFPAAASADLIRFAFAGSQTLNNNNGSLSNANSCNNNGNFNNTGNASSMNCTSNGMGNINSNILTHEFSSVIDR